MKLGSASMFRRRAGDDHYKKMKLYGFDYSDYAISGALDGKTEEEYKQSLIEAKIKNEKLGYVGEITNINIAPVLDLLEKGYIPVISTIGCDKLGNAYNINGDTAAAFIAGAMNAEKLFMMTDIDGILRDKDDPTTIIPHLTVSEAKKLYDEGVVSGGMIPKVDCCIEAINKGVKNVTIMDGRVSHSILMELLTDEGAGTMVVGD